MAKRRSPAIEVFKTRNNRVLFLNHIELIEDDIAWLAATERLTAWNVKIPAGLLARLEKLWWLDLRGGSATDLAVARGANKLRFFAVNQVRGMNDLSVIRDMIDLRYLSLYGLPKVTRIPSLASLTKLEHAMVGQMRGLLSLRGLLDAPKLRELELVRKISLNTDDVEAIRKHLAIKQFAWRAEDVPNKVWVPVVEKINLPEMDCGHPEEWFGLSDW